MAHRIIENEADLIDLGRLLGRLKLPVTVEWRQGRDRSLEQNRLAFMWAKEAAEQLGDRTAEEVRCRWKLEHGVPIMREESADFREVYDKTLKPLPYQAKLKLMAFFPVSSLMTVPQMSRYLDTIQRECLEQGLRLTEPPLDTRRRKAA